MIVNKSDTISHDTCMKQNSRLCISWNTSKMFGSCCKILQNVQCICNKDVHTTRFLFFYLFILFIYYFGGGNFPFSHTIQTLQFIYTTRHYTHYIGIFRSRDIYIYLCNEIIPISQVITTHFWNNLNQVRSKTKAQKAK